MKYKLILLLTIILVIGICLPAFALTNGDGSVDIGGGIVNPTTNQTVAQKIINIYKGCAYTVGSIAALCLLGVGVMFIKSRGKERELSEAKTWLTYIVIGIGVVALALIIVGFVIWLLTQ